MSELVTPKNYINLIAGVVNLFFEQVNNLSNRLPAAKVTVEMDIIEKKAAPAAKPKPFQPSPTT